MQQLDELDAKTAGGLDAALFRDAMAQVASAVHIVTTDGPHGRAGLTATAVASVSAAPPTLLACIERGSATLGAIERNGRFCINTLAAGDASLAERFAGRMGVRGEARFEQGDWRVLATGAPVLAGALVSFDCRLVAAHDAATHRILIGEVVALAETDGGAGLVYRGRAFYGA